VTDVLYYATDSRITPRAKDILRKARNLAYGPEEIEIVETSSGVGALNFGFFPDLPDTTVRTMSPREMPFVPHAEFIIAAAMRRYRGTFEYRSPKPGANILWFDTEAYSVDDRWRMDPREYTRLFQYAWNEDAEVTLTSDYDEMIELIESADVSVAQQGHGFDWSVLYGRDSHRPLELALEGRLFDPKVFASVNFPAPPWYITRKGHYQKDAAKPGNAVHGWFSLSNLSYQLGVPGKEGDLKALAAEFGGFGAIPLDDPRYTAYARQDVTTLRDMTSGLLQFASPDEYDWREQLKAAINAQISRNGLRVHKTNARKRIAQLGVRKDELLSKLVREYGFPTTGKAPWSSKLGREAIIRILQDGGVDPLTNPDWPQGKTGPSLGGPVLTEHLEGTALEETGMLLAELSGQRPLAQQALTYVQPDGRVHPEYETFQRSGRTSVTKPGMTTWGNREERLRVEKEYFVPDTSGQDLFEYDFAQADARIVAAYSGDAHYAELFAEDADMHEIRARAIFGEAKYESNVAKYRQDIKPINHGSNYGLGKVKLAGKIGVSIAEAGAMLAADAKFYSDVTEWKKRVVAFADRHGYIINDWGRWMSVDPGREYTQTPALQGQSGTMEIMFDALIRMLKHDIRLILWLKLTVHDALVFSIPRKEQAWATTKIPELMYTVWEPKDGTGQPIEFKVTGGTPGKTWALASH